MRGPARSPARRMSGGRSRQASCPPTPATGARCCWTGCGRPSTPTWMRAGSLAAQAQIRAHAERMAGRCFGNPHSENPASAASTELVERARHAVLAHFNAPPGEYAAIFTPNATGACRLVGEAYPFSPRTRLVLTQDNHNSVNGLREFAAARGAAIQYVPFGPAELRVDADAIGQALARPRPGALGAARRVAAQGVRDAGRPVAALSAVAAGRRRGLLAYPA